MDEKGKITIPEHLRRRAGIQGFAVFVGSHTGDYFEIWREDCWRLEVEAALEQLDSMAFSSFSRFLGAFTPVWQRTRD